MLYRFTNRFGVQIWVHKKQLFLYTIRVYKQTCWY